MRKNSSLRLVMLLLLLIIFPNISSQTFTEQTDITLTGVYQSSVAWGDYDNDGYLDILLTGINNEGEYTTKIYHNHGDNTFTEMTGIVKTQVGTSSAEWGDYDGDGDLDILLTGSSNSDYISKIFRNDGNNTFTDSEIQLAGVYGWSGSSSWSDYDNDGDLDVLIAGVSALGYIALIYRNDGNDIFTKQTNISLQGYAVGTSAWGDYDNDGDLDILLTGYVNNGVYLAAIYKNNGNNSFSEQTGIQLPGVQSGSGVFGDYDNDGDLDIFITGLDISGKTITKIFMNNGDNSFIEQINQNFIGAGDSQLALGDYDNDGDIDVLLTGHSDLGQMISKIYDNDGIGNYTERQDIILTGVYWGSSAWGDYDNDGDLDIVLTGGTNSNFISKIFRNELKNENLKPSAPSNLIALINGGTVNLKWDKSTDHETPQNTLNYNIYIYENGKVNYESPPHSFPQTELKNGKRLISKPGNIQWNSSGFNIRDLSPGKTYNWSVQAIDAGLQGGDFSIEQSFTIPLYRPSVQADYITFSNINLPNITVSWSNGSGSKRAVFIMATSTGTADPIDNTTYNVNDLTPGGWKCVYNGSGNSTEVDGLAAGVQYRLHVCEYNGDPENELYLKSESYHNPAVPNTILLEQSQYTFPAGYIARAKWINYDNDDFLDFVLASNNFFIIYHNNGDYSFEESGTILFSTFRECSFTWGDYDNDNDLDILVTGMDGSNNPISRIYSNNSGNSFTEQTNISLTGVSSGSADWGDYDNDGDLDILLTGLVSSNAVSKIYRNNGSGSFTEQAGIEIIDISQGSVSWGDYNNDSFLDILLTGKSNLGPPVSRIYRNNTNNSFTELDASLLTGVRLSSCAWGDYDNDGDLDILLCGFDISSKQISKVYRNDGNDKFTEQTGILLTGVYQGSIAWVDYDNDGDLDISVAGNAGADIISKIYNNNGDNTFSEKLVFTGFYNGDISWGDYDNDGDPDLLVTGRIMIPEDSYATTIYKNEITNPNYNPPVPNDLKASWENEYLVFKWSKLSDNSTPGSPLSYNIRVGTIPGGNNIKSGQALVEGKLLMPGINLINDTIVWLRLPVNKYYWSVQSVEKGWLTSSFAPEEMIQADSIQSESLRAIIKNNSSLLLRWKNGNGTGRVVFCRISSPEGSPIPANNKIYHAESFFSQGDLIESTTWYCVYNGKADSTIIYGLSEKYSYDIQVIEYVNINGSPIYFDTEGKGNPGIFSTSLFSDQTGIQLTGLSQSSVQWADYDNDGDLDILLTGTTNGHYSGGVTKIYSNNGNNSFTEQTDIILAGISYGNAAWGDFNNDDTLDIIVTGKNISNQEITKIYLNNGENIFTELENLTIPGISYGKVSCGDYDNDNFLDIMITGKDNSGHVIAKIFRNTGDNDFIEQLDIILPGVSSSSSAWGDYDNDGDLDILVSGTTNGNYTGVRSTIFTNHGNNIFIEEQSITLIGLFNSSVAWGDYDNDDDIDILMSGVNVQNQSSSEIYQNNGNNIFSILLDAGLTDSKTGSVFWADFNNDGSLDIMITGLSSKIYHNDNDNTFTEYTGSSFPNSSFGSASSGDYDNDGDIDILITGGGLSRIYRNNTFMKAGEYPANQKPIAPIGLSSISQPEGIHLSWAPIRTDETPFKAMTYNVRMWTSAGGPDITAAHSNPISGYRQIAAMGNAQLDTSFLIKNLPLGTYYWSVQAVDQGYLGGDWAETATFEVENIQTFFSFEQVCLGYPTRFTDQSTAFSGIASWRWDFNDGEISSDQNPSHTYASSGTFMVKLIITDMGGVKDSLIQAVFVKPKPITNFSAPAVCQGTAAIITNTTDKNELTISSWYWDFGDGQTSLSEQPASHGYLGAADYSVQLKALASNGCRDSITKTVTVASYPVAAVTANALLTFCKGDSVTLSVPYNNDYLYTWKLNETAVSGADSNRFAAKLTGSYVAEVTNSKGNCKTTSSPVSIISQSTPDAPFITSSGNITFCQGDTVILSAPSNTDYKYQWKLNGGAVGTNFSQYVARTSGTYNLVVTNSTGCSVTSTNTVTITVNPVPVVGALALEGKKRFCYGENAILSIPAVTGYIYSWKNSDGIIAGATSNSYSATSSGTYTLEVAYTSGCRVRTDPVTIEVVDKPLKPTIDYSGYSKGMCLGENPLKLNIDKTVTGYSYRWYKNGTPYSNATFIEITDGAKYHLEAYQDICTSPRDSIDIVFIQTLSKPDIIAKGPTVWYLSTGSDANYYKWYYNGSTIAGASGSSYVAGQNMGIYRLAISDDNQCFSFSDTIRIPKGITGIEDIDPFEDVKIYPNPTTGLFTIEMNNNIFGELVIDIFTQSGSKVINIKFDKTTEHFQSQIDLSGQPNGMYLINLSLDKFRAVKKVLVE
ncbi:MAG TPA: FG-GAP-like repeat-containing protein [Bacteroidales bacterium]|nr:FG-GAP-like repeat-containing protein [Bacteroidales bacterium]